MLDNNPTFGIKFIPKSRVDETRQIIPIMAYFTVTMLPNSTMTGVTAIPATTMVYTEKMTILESLSSFTLIFLVSKAKIRLSTISIILYTKRIGAQIWTLSEVHRYTSVGSSPVCMDVCFASTFYTFPPFSYQLTPMFI